MNKKTFRCKDCKSHNKENIYCEHGRSQNPNQIVQVGATRYCFYFMKGVYKKDDSKKR